MGQVPRKNKARNTRNCSPLVNNMQDKVCDCDKPATVWQGGKTSVAATLLVRSINTGVP